MSVVLSHKRAKSIMRRTKACDVSFLFMWFFGTVCRTATLSLVVRMAGFSANALSRKTWIYPGTLAGMYAPLLFPPIAALLGS